MSVSYISMSRVPSAFGTSRTPAAMSRTKPAGQTSMAGAPPNAYGVDSRGRWVDSEGRPLDASGLVVGTAGSGPAAYSSQVTVTSVPSTPAVTAPGSGNCSSILPAGAVGCDSNGTAIDSNGNTVSWPAATVTVGQPSGVTTSPITTPSKTVSDPSIQALYAAVAPSIGITGDIITQAIQDNNEQALANIKLSAQSRMAQLQALYQTSMASGNFSLAQQQLQQAAQLQQFGLQISANQGSNIALYVIGAIVALGIVAAVVYSKPRESGQLARRNPRRAKHRSSKRYGR